MSAYSDKGWWVTVGKTIRLSDSQVSATWIGKIGPHGIGTAKKPGRCYDAAVTTPYCSFYTKG